MVKSIKYVALSLLLALGAASCVNDGASSSDESTQRENFLALTEPAISLNGVVVRSFDKSSDQIISNDSKTLFSISDYTYTNYVTVSINGDLKEGEAIGVSYRSAGVEGLDGGNASMTLLKEDAATDSYWLWDAEKRLGVMVRIY